jgi:hypothetical protein
MRHLLLLLFPALLAAQQSTPVFNGKLINALNANSQNLLGVNYAGFGAGTPLARLHILPDGTPTTLANGIRWGSDVGIYRSASNTIKLQGDLVVTGTISGADGIVALDGDNVFTGGNTFNGGLTIAGSTEFQAGFTVANTTVRDTIRSSLALVPGTNVQAYSARLADIVGLNPQDSYVIVGNGSAWVAESGSTLRTSLGLGSSDNVTFAATSITTLTTSGVATINGKLTAAAALSDATGLQLGSAGAWYGSGSGIVTDDLLTANNDVVLGDQTTDSVTVTGLLKLSAGGDAALQRTSSGVITVTGGLVAPSITLAAPLATGSGGLGLDMSSSLANQIPYTSGTGAFALTSLTTLARGLLGDASESDMRTRLQLGGAALLAVGTTSGTVAAGDDSRFTNSRAPTGSAAGAGSDIEGNYPTSLTIKADAVALGTDTTGNYVASLTAGTGVTFGGTNAAEGAIPVINIGQSVATAATPTFGGLTLTGALTGATGTFDDSVTTVDLSVTGTATFSTPPSFTSLALETLTLNQGATSTGRVAGLTHSRVLNVDKDHPQATDTRTGLLLNELFRPFATISAATTASLVDSVVRIWPASTEYAVPAEFGLDLRRFELMGGAEINGLETTADVDYAVTGNGTITGDVTVNNSGAVITIDVPVEGNVTITSGTVEFRRAITGTLTVAGGTVRILDTVSGAVSISSGTLTLLERPASTIAQTGGTLELRNGYAAAITMSGSGSVLVAHGRGLANFTQSAGAATLAGPVTGVLACSGGTCDVLAPVTGSVTITGGTLNLRSSVTRTTSGTAVSLSSGTLNLHGGSSVSASSSSEVAISRSGGTWNAYGAHSILGTTSGAVTVAGRSVNPVASTTVALTADNQTVTPGTTTRLFFTSDDATGTNRTITLSTTGAVLGEQYILFAPSSNAMELPDNTANGVQLSADWTPDAGDTLTLVFDGTYFRQTSVSAN